MSLATIPYGALSIPELLSIHNVMACERGTLTLRSWRNSHVRLVERVAILRTRKPIPAPTPEPKPKPRRSGRAAARIVKSKMRNAILKALAVVSHYEDSVTGNYVSRQRALRMDRSKLIPVGLPYSEVARRVRVAVPGTVFSPVCLRVYAARVRGGEPGYERCKLPHKRPHGTPKAKPV